MKKLINNLFFFGFISISILSLSTKAQEKLLRIGAIPDQYQETLDRRFNLLSKELSKQLNLKVKYVPVVNYLGAVTGFRSKNLDLVWFGGLTGVQARLQTPNSIVIAQRDIDKEFKSVFIVNKKIKLTPAKELSDLKNLRNLRFTFGSENSTSGRLMPEYFLNIADVKTSEFKGKKPGFSGSHDATIALVNSGAFEAGALNIQVWEKNLKNNPKRTKNVYVYFVTPSYVDYHWLLQGDLDEKFYDGLTEKIKKAILNLNETNPNHKEILEMFNAKKFINSDANQYKNIEEIGRKLKKIR